LEYFLYADTKNYNIVIFFNKELVDTYSKFFEGWRFDEVAKITAFQVGYANPHRFAAGKVSGPRTNELRATY